MNPGLSADDERVIAELGAIARKIDHPPATVYELGRQAYQLYRIDDELAALVADSWLDSHAVRAVASDTRLLSFECPGTAIEIEVSREGTTLVILGQLTRPGTEPVRGEAFLQFRSGHTLTTGIDSAGRFEFTATPEASARFRLDTAGARTVVTAWTRL
jgi:hypothetical protein